MLYCLLDLHDPCEFACLVWTSLSLPHLASQLKLLDSAGFEYPWCGSFVALGKARELSRLLDLSLLNRVGQVKAAAQVPECRHSSIW